MIDPIEERVQVNLDPPIALLDHSPCNRHSSMAANTSPWLLQYQTPVHHYAQEKAIPDSPVSPSSLPHTMWVGCDHRDEHEYCHIHQSIPDVQSFPTTVVTPEPHHLGTQADSSGYYDLC
ncbi:MAG: hypothetical protein L0H46_02305 [Brevibacterium sp.]|nr:hypothetical protein [Brevibacterium sp.]MDN5876245.1 hypothetical protein [Brevibacterium sp.]MDN5909627.1 hypothetical protein [Brevibacterium sp.]MDN6158064.1 hypothetical protein [Brevibacterium sp.]MDN6604963.1 hypothetical protein [Brevibacterium sp.]